ncbi:MAG: phosphotransferase [Actinomycetota bacterium]
MSDPDHILYTSHPDLGLVLNSGTDLIAAALGPSISLASSARPVQIRFIPGRSVVAQFTAMVAIDGGEPRTETFVITVGRRIPQGIAVVTAGEAQVGVWQVPDDPYLPGLKTASSEKSAGQLLEQLGVESEGATSRRRAYRPGRRAVVEIRTRRERVFAKIVRPERIAQLQNRHDLLVGQAPIPTSLGWSEAQGIVMLQALDGISLLSGIEGGGDALPSAASLLDLLDSLEGIEVPGTTRPRLVDRVTSHAEFISTVHPKLEHRASALAHTIEELARPEPHRTMHGDFHSSQIMIQHGEITGLVDIDTVGSGERTDDLANILAHLAAVASARPNSAQAAARYGAELTSGFGSVVDPRQLRVRVAAALLGFALGPFRVQEANWRNATEKRLELAEQWLASAATTSL